MTEHQPSLRRIAISRLHLPDGSILLRQVVEIIDGCPVRYFPLTDEIPFTEWLGGDYVWAEHEEK